MGIHYDHRQIEEKWQKIWHERKCFVAKEDKNRKKFYILEMFPYPSGKIHMGHVRNYALGDVAARYYRAKNYNVLHPMGWDSFGLPAENAAIEQNLSPADWTRRNIDNMREQLKSVGLSYDWDREISTCEADYFKHEQKFFLELMEKALLYRKDGWVNWDPVDETVLANEQVVDGKGWRSGVQIERKKLSGWFAKITDYSNELLSDLQQLKQWPDKVRKMQEAWIGKSHGVVIRFELIGQKDKLEVYTTRPDTIFGMSFVAIAPQHPIALELSEKNKEIADFLNECNKVGTSEEAIEKIEKIGMKTNIEVVHPFNGKKFPLYIANFILMDYGTGAVFGCPAHDSRDLEFARKYDLEVMPVISPDGKANFEIKNKAYTESGKIINSEFLNGMNSDSGKAEIIKRLEKAGIGKKQTNFRLRDWGVSRQRYWGCPIPVIHCLECGAIPVEKTLLPILPPEVDKLPKSGNILDMHPHWKHTKCPKCGGKAERETDTLDTFFESSWYFLRFCSPKSENGIDKDKADYWMNVDLYIGGAEHAVLHLLYARFFTKALRDLGYVSSNEPFEKMVTQGMVCHISYKSEDGRWLFPEQVEIDKNGEYREKKNGNKVIVGRAEKMSKSKKNVVDPNDIIENYGSDTARIFMLSDSPPERDLEWTDAGIGGAHRYLSRIWSMVTEFYLKYNSQKEIVNNINLAKVNDDKLINLRRITNKAIKNISEDIEKLHLNVVVAHIREFSNEIMAIDNPNIESMAVKKEAIEVFLHLLYPLAPHLAEDLWRLIGNKKILAESLWPKLDESLLTEDETTVAIQVNGKLRGTLKLIKDYSPKDAEEQALKISKVKMAVDGKKILKIINIPGKIINVVVG